MRQLRVNIFDTDQYNLRLFEVLLEARGYEALGFEEALGCPVYGSQDVQCLAARPCADIVIVDKRMPQMTGIEMLLMQASRGCKVDNRNKALAATDLDHKEIKALEGLGCSYIRKPFRVGGLYSWLDKCEKRVDLAHPLGVIRKERRIPAVIDVLFRSDSDERMHAGTVVNFSGRGLCLRAVTQLQPREPVIFSTALPNNCTRSTVRWVEERGGYHLAGLLSQ